MWRVGWSGFGFAPKGHQQVAVTWLSPVFAPEEQNVYSTEAPGNGAPEERDVFLRNNYKYMSLLTERRWFLRTQPINMLLLWSKGR